MSKQWRNGPAVGVIVSCFFGRMDGRLWQDCTEKVIAPELSRLYSSLFMTTEMSRHYSSMEDGLYIHSELMMQTMNYREVTPTSTSTFTVFHSVIVPLAGSGSIPANNMTIQAERLSMSSPIATSSYLVIPSIRSERCTGRSGARTVRWSSPAEELEGPGPTRVVPLREDGGRLLRNDRTEPSISVECVAGGDDGNRPV